MWYALQQNEMAICILCNAFQCSVKTNIMLHIKQHNFYIRFISHHVPQWKESKRSLQKKDLYDVIDDGIFKFLCYLLFVPLFDRAV